MDDYYVKMESARDQWDEFPEEVRGEVERHFVAARERGFEMERSEYEWRRVGVAKSLIEAKDGDDELGPVAKAGIKEFPKLTGQGDWEAYLRDFDELIEPAKPAHLRIRMLRQVMGTEAKRRLDSYLMPAMLYSDYNEYVRDATPILEPPGETTRRGGKQSAAFRGMARKAELGSSAIARRNRRRYEALRWRNVSYDSRQCALTSTRTG
jgi:hypothetical protein